MRLDDLRPSDNVEDRRGMGGFGGRGLAIGGGGLGSVVVVIVLLLLGVDPSTLLSADQGAPAQQQAQVDPASRTDNAEFDLARRVVGSSEDVWSQVFQQAGRTYQPAVFVPYDTATQTAGCGGGQSAMGPFYCPADQRVYIDLSFFQQLGTRFGAPGRFAQAYVVAHEVGHHVQNQLGISEQADQAQRAAGDEVAANRISVAVELQADCFAGVWANRANRTSRFLEPGDVEQGLAAANAVGDDNLQRASRGRVVPESFTHGSSAQRVQWFRRGLDSGDPNACDTFGRGRVF